MVVPTIDEKNRELFIGSRGRVESKETDGRETVSRE